MHNLVQPRPPVKITTDSNRLPIHESDINFLKSMFLRVPSRILGGFTIQREFPIPYIQPSMKQTININIEFA